MSHSLIKHEAGLRLVAVEDATGKIVETLREGGSVVRRENGVAAASPLFTGSESEAAAVLDGLAGAIGAKAPAPVPAAPAAPASIPVLAAQAASAPAQRGSMGLTAAVSALALSVVAFGGFFAYRDLQAAKPQQVAAAGEWKPPSDFPYRDTNATDPVAPPATVSRGAVVTSQPATPNPPSVVLPSAQAPAPVVEAKADEAKADAGRPPLRGGSVGLARQEYAPLTKDNVYGSQTPPTKVPPGSSVVAPQVADAAKAASPVPTVAGTGGVTPAPKPVAEAPKAAPLLPKDVVQANALANAGPDAGTLATALATKVEAVRQENEVQQAEARKTVTEHGAEKSSDDMEKLKAVLATLERGEKVTMAVVSRLPHEIAQKLREAGVVASDEDEALIAKAGGGADYRIVRLPPDAVDKLRDKDGTPTVPTANSWAATGGNVRIPLPGGGEIKTAEDLSKAFHLQP